MIAIGKDGEEPYRSDSLTDWPLKKSGSKLYICDIIVNKLICLCQIDFSYEYWANLFSNHPIALGPFSISYLEAQVTWNFASK